ncbi:MAG: hypothetical protein KGH53_03810 [Candidatus Micrarchaeota archaeon]|nr:hypothetical protein [Candidatus Micrarchaeota archaeon]
MGAAQIFRSLFGSKAVIAATALIAIAYFYLIEYVISLNAPGGYTFVTVPPILLYLLSLSAAVFLVISAFSLRFAILRVQSEVELAVSALSTIVGGIIAGCSCSVPILASILYIFALNAATVSGLLAFIGNYQVELFGALILFNVAISYHHLDKLSQTCVIRKGRIQERK